MICRSIIVAAGFLSFIACAGAAELPAKSHRLDGGKACCEPYRYAYAEVWYGNRKVVAPVRRSPMGDEVELPGGLWVLCGFSCEYTLRKQHLHDLENQGAGSGSQFAPDYPRADSYVDGWGVRHGYLF